MWTASPEVPQTQGQKRNYPCTLAGGGHLPVSAHQLRQWQKRQQPRQVQQHSRPFFILVPGIVERPRHHPRCHRSVCGVPPLVSWLPSSIFLLSSLSILNTLLTENLESGTPNWCAASRLLHKFYILPHALLQFIKHIA